MPSKYDPSTCPTCGKPLWSEGDIFEWEGLCYLLLADHRDDRVYSNSLALICLGESSGAWLSGANPSDVLSEGSKVGHIGPVSLGMFIRQHVEYGK